MTVIKMGLPEPEIRGTAQALPENFDTEMVHRVAAILAKSRGLSDVDTARRVIKECRNVAREIIDGDHSKHGGAQRGV